VRLAHSASVKFVWLPRCTIAYVNDLVTFTIDLIRSSAVAERPRDASCLSVVSFNIPTAQFFYY